MPNSGQYYSLTCRFCDTLLTVVPEQQGTEVECPDCFSMLKVGPPPATKQKNPNRGGRSWNGNLKQPADAGDASRQAVTDDIDLLPVANDIRELVNDDLTNTGGPSDTVQDSGEIKLAAAVVRPPAGTSYGLDNVDANLLAPRKRKRKSEASDEVLGKEDLMAADELDAVVDEPLPVDEPLSVDDIPRLESLGTLVPESEPAAPSAREPGAKRGASVSATARPARKKRKPSQKSGKRRQNGPKHSRPKFKHAELFMAIVGMVTDGRVMLATVVAGVLMMFGGLASESILPVGASADSLGMKETLIKSGLKLVFGYVPYFVGLFALWAVASFIFRSAAQGHAKVQLATAVGAEFWPTFWLFSFSFFVAGLPAAVVAVVMIPMRMLIAPLFLISAMYNQSPWAIVNTDWFSVVAKQRAQWSKVYTWFIVLALLGGVTGGLFYVRQWVDVFAVDVLLTVMAIGLNVVVTLVFATIAGWHTGAVIERIARDD